MHALRAFGFLILGLAFLSGCTSSGGKLIMAKGQLLNKQKPLKVASNMGVSVLFIPLVDESKHHDTYPADPLNEDAIFVVPGKNGKGIPPGKYRIAINFLMVGTPPPEIQRMNELFDRQTSGIVREVTSEELIVIDLSKPGG